jgi:hypothetical protein
MKLATHLDSIKQKEIVKTVIFLTVGVIYILWNAIQALIAIFQ